MAADVLEARTLLSSTIVVTTTADSGAGSLREAIDNANATSGVDMIAFDIGSGHQTINLATALPQITDSIVIDGTTQPGYAGMPLIELSGNGIGGNGLFITAGGSTVKGLIINGFTSPNGGSYPDGAGIWLMGGGGNVIQGNLIGTDFTGTSSVANSIGIAVLSAGNLIGTNGDGVDDAAERNVVSGNTAGLQFGIALYTTAAHDNVIAGNYVGVDVTGTASLVNGTGVWNGGSAYGNRIGTDGNGIADVAERNVVAASLGDAISIQSGSHDIVIAGNYVGTDAAGTTSLVGGAGGRGIAVYGLSTTAIRIGTDGNGVADADEGNLVAKSTNIQQILVRGVTNSIIAGNYVGIDAGGDQVVSASRWGIWVENSSGIVIGTNGDGVSDDVEGNVSAGNYSEYNVYVMGTQNSVIAGNRLGLAANSDSSLGSAVGGIRISNSTGIRVGTNGDEVSDGEERNTIAGDISFADILLEASQNLVIAGNSVGVNASGTQAIGAGVYGLFVANSTNVLVGTDGDGTADAAERNIISGNFAVDGIYLLNTQSSVFAGNYIGVDATGSQPLGYKGFSGIGVYDSSNNRFGTNGDGTSDTLEGNIIAYAGAGSTGVAIVAGSTGNSVRGNSIYGSVNLGIELVGDGVSPNDAGDVDAGPNGLQNFPVLATVMPGATTHVIGSLQSTPNSTFVVDFYANRAPDASGYGEGERWLGWVTVTTDANGDASFDTVLAAGTSYGEFITATATAPDGSTSEFSQALFAGATSGNDTIVVDAGTVPGTLKITVNGTVYDDVPATAEVLVAGLGGDDVFTVNASLVGGLRLTGQEGSDSYTVNFGNLAGPIQIADDGATGTDSLTVNGTAGDDVIFKDEIVITWGSPVTETVNRSGIEALTIHGGNGNDQITDPGSNTTIFGDAGNDTIVINATSGSGVVVYGGAGSDAYQVAASGLAGPVTIIDTGATGSDSLTILGSTGDDSVVQSSSGMTVNGTAINFSGGLETVSVEGGGGSDSLTVVGTPTVPVQVEDVADMIVQGTSGDDVILFTSVGNQGRIRARLNGVVVAEFAPTGRLTAYGRAGNDDIQVAGDITLSAWLYGNKGDDRLKGGAGNDVLLGGAGDDLLQGGAGRDVLVGGRGSDRIVGNADDDLMIAGRLKFANRDQALKAILAEWTSSRSYAARIANLSGTGSGSSFANRQNGDTYLQSGVTVVADGACDVLTGSAGKDWFLFDDDLDRATDLKDEVFTNELDWLYA